MKNKYPNLISAIFLVLLVSQTHDVRSQSAGHIVYIHGIFSSNSELSTLATAMHGAPYSLGSDYIFGDYASLGLFNGIVTQAIGIEDQATYVWGSSKKVIVGHSMGGVEGRSEAQQFTSTTMGYVTVDAPNAGARFADLDARQNYVNACAKDRGNIERQTIGVLGSIAGICEQIVGCALDLISWFGQSINANVQDLVPGSTFINNLQAGAATEVAAFGTRRCAVWSSCMTPRLPAYNSTQIQTDQNSFKSSISYCQGQSHSYDQTANDMASSINWRHPWNAYKWPAIIYDRSRAGDYTAAANGYTDMNASWEKNTEDGQDGDSFISVASQQKIGMLSSGHLFEVGTDGSATDQVNHGGAVYGWSNGFLQIHAAMVAAGAN